jgi:hypothetical protein
MIAARQVLATVRSQDELIEALRAARDYRNLSYKFLDEIGGFAMGHMERVLGPRREKGMSHIVFQTLLSMLAVKLELVPDPEQAARMQERWEGRDVRNVRVDSGRISKLLI